MAANDRNDVKAILRKREFPLCIREALTKIEELLCVSAAITNRQQLMKQSELINELITEFIFNQVDRRGMRKKVSRLQELDIVQNIANYMLFDGKNINRSTSNSLYITLFPAQIHDRMKMAVTLASFAISTRNIPVLTATTVLLQQHSYTSPYSFEFVQKIIFELNLLLPVNSASVFELAKIAPIFAANFLTRLVEMYRNNDSNAKSLPPLETLNMILLWLEGNSRLCIVPVMSNFQPNVLPSTILITPITPHIGLIKWCIVAHLENTPNSKLYSNLEQYVIESIALCRSTSGLVHNNIITTQDLMPIVGSIVSNGHPERQKRAIESLVKIIRVALITNVLSGSKQDLRRNLQSLPYNEALVVLVEDMAIVP